MKRRTNQIIVSAYPVGYIQPSTQTETTQMKITELIINVTDDKKKKKSIIIKANNNDSVFCSKSPCEDYKNNTLLDIGNILVDNLLISITSNVSDIFNCNYNGLHACYDKIIITYQKIPTATTHYFEFYILKIRIGHTPAYLTIDEKNGWKNSYVQTHG